MIKDFFAELFNSLLQILLKIFLLPYCIIVTIIRVFMICTLLFPIRFSWFFKFKDKSNKYLALKTINVIICVIPFLAITIVEFTVMLCELLVTKIVSAVLTILPLIDIIPNLIFGIITFALVKLFDLLQFVMIISDRAYIGYSEYASINPIMENCANI